jgi:pyruvate kinase
MRYAKEEARLPHGSITDAVCSSAKEAAEVSRASALMLFTDSWETVLRYSRLCSRVRSVLVTDSFGLAGRSGLCGPIYATVSKKQFKAEEICQTAKIIALENGLAIAGNNIVVLNCISTDYSVTVRRL